MKKLKTIFLMLFLFMGLNAMAVNSIVNGDFSDGTNGWTIACQNAADADVYDITTSEDGLQIAQTTAASGRLDIYQDVPVERSAFYVLSFDYKATHKKFRLWSFMVSDNDVWVYFTDDAKTDSLRTKNGYFEVASDWENMSYPIRIADVDTIHTLRVMFRVYKQADCTVNLRNVYLSKQSGNDPTGFDELGYNEERYKFIKDGKLYFKNGDMLYDVLGRPVK